MSAADGDWEVAWDPLTKRHFYQSRSLGQSTWEQPPGCTTGLPTEPPEHAQAYAEVVQANQANLPNGWFASWDPIYKRAYYYNQHTKQRTWQRPGTATGPVHPSTSSNEELQRAGPAPAADRQLPRPYGPDGKWDPEAFLRMVQQAKQAGNDRQKLKRVFKEVSEHNYKMRSQWKVPETRLVNLQQCMQGQEPPRRRADDDITFSLATTADAALYFKLRNEEVCALNFANGKDVGGGYKTGAIAQEEDLCRRMPNLYTSLFNAQRSKLYPFGPPTCADASHPARYSDVLWTPGAVLARAGEAEGFKMLKEERQVAVHLVSAAAPNLRFGNPTEIYDEDLLYKTVKCLLRAPLLMEPRVTTLILGAWGCGAFGGNPEGMAGLFCRALKDEGMGRYYKEVHFAIPSFGDQNADRFRQVFQQMGVTVRDVSIPSTTN